MKGLSDNRVSFRYVLPNAVRPVITYAGLSLGQLVGGAVVMETIFSMPGIGACSSPRSAATTTRSSLP